MKKGVMVILMAGLVAGCAAPRYVSEPGPSTGKITYRAVEGWNTSFGIMALAPGGCLHSWKLATHRDNRQPDGSYLTHVPASRTVYLQMHLLNGSRSCASEVKFESEPGYDYRVEPQLAPGGCRMDVQQVQGDAAPAPVKTLRRLDREENWC